MIGFWIVAGLLTAAVVTLLAWPLMRKCDAADTGGTNLAVYRDQLDELARDRARGLIEIDQAASMETEISRRMLAAARSADTPAPRTMAARWTTAAMTIALPVGAVFVYLAVGQPGLPGEPLAERQISLDSDPGKERAQPRRALVDEGSSAADIQAVQQMTPEQQQAMIRSMVDGLAATLQAHPIDAEGWRRLAQAYWVLGDADKAKDALARAEVAESRKTVP